MSKLTSYNPLTSPAQNDLMLIVDVSDTVDMGPTGTDKKITVAGLGTAFGANWFNVVGYGADITGISDSTTAIQAAWTAAAAVNGVVYYPPGVYKQNSTVTENLGGASVVAWMDPGAKVMFYGSGDAYRIYDSSSYNARVTQKVGFAGFGLIDGTNSSSGSACAAIHIGDIVQVVMYVSVSKWYNNTGSKGVWFDNNYNWTEQIYGRIYTQSCATNVQFDNSVDTSGSSTGSFERMLLDIFLETNGVGDGVTFANGGFMSNGSIGIYGNAGPSATTQHAILKLTGSNSQNSSNIAFGELRIAVELDGTNTFMPQTINFASGGNGIYKCTGYIDFSQGNAFVVSNNAGEFLFSGPVYGDTTLYPMRGLDATAASQTISANAQTVSTGYVSRNRLGCSASYTGLILAAGGFEGQEVILTNVGTGTLTFAASGTSHVADGAADSLAPNSQRRYTWDVSKSLWYSDTAGANMMTSLATTTSSGVALSTSATQTILAWTAPSDGLMHRVTVFAQMHVTSTLASGGAPVEITLTFPDAGSASKGTIFGTSSTAVGFYYLTNNSTPSTFLIESGTTFSILQNSILSSGAGLVFAELWGS